MQYLFPFFHKTARSFGFAAKNRLVAAKIIALFIFFSAPIAANIKCPNTLSYEDMARIRNKKMSVYNTNFFPYPREDFQLPLFPAIVSLSDSRVIEKDAKIICNYTYSRSIFLGGQTYNLKVRAIKPKNVSVECIANLNRIFKNLPQDGETLAVFDWDQTLSSKVGNFTLRDRSTREILKTLHQRGIKTLVLSSRGVRNIASITPEIIEGVTRRTDKMVKVLGNEWISHGALKEKNFSSCTGISGKLNLITQNDIVLVGPTSTKGNALAELIDSDRLRQRPTNIIFVDHALQHVESVADVFSKRNENVYIFHYPNPLASKGDSACPPDLAY